MKRKSEKISFSLFICLVFLTQISFATKEVNWPQMWQLAKSDTAYIRKLAKNANDRQIMRLGFWDSLYTLSKQQNYDFGIGASNEMRGYIFYSNNKPADAIIAWKEALPIYERLKLHDVASAVLNNMGYLFQYSGKTDMALDCYFRAVKHLDTIGDKINLASVIANVASVLADMHEFEKSFLYYRKALSVWSIINDKPGICRTYNNIAYTFLQAGDADSSLYYLEKARMLADLLQEKSILHNIYIIMGDAHLMKSEPGVAADYYNEALILSNEVDNDAGRSSALLKIAELDLRDHKIAEAKQHAEGALYYAKKKEFAQHIRDAAFLLVKVYKAEGNAVAALEMQDLAYKLKDSINNAESQKAMLQQQFQYEYEKKETELKAIQEKESQLYTEENRKQRMMLFATIGGLTLVALTALVLFQRFRVTRRQKKIIEEQKAEVDAAYHKLDEKNREVMDSIRYAKRIQTSLLPNERYIEKKLGEMK